MNKAPFTIFGLDEYRTLVRYLAGQPRPCVGFYPRPQAGLLLRLDVDYDLEWAAETAVINAAENVCATYFVLVGSPLYNIASQTGRNALATIAACGQWIGLHYEHRKGEGDLDLLRLEQEFALLRLIAPSAQRLVAWHNPSGDLALLNRKAVDAGFVCAYEDSFFAPDCYASDSNMRNTGSALAAFVRECPHPIVQILLHPFNWGAGGRDMSEVLLRTLRRKFDRVTAEFEGNRVWAAGLGEAVKRDLTSCCWYGEEQ